MTRVQLNMVASHERRLLTWLCVHMPRAITPDTLTVVSVIGAMLAFGGYVGSRFDPAWLWLASAGLVINWFGDSLDGSLARHRKIERPRYGYFLDHTVDALNNLMMMVGLGLTYAVRMDAALFALVGYYLLCMYVFINNHLSGVFRLSFLGFGPTELRLCLVVINASMFFVVDPPVWVVGSDVMSVYDAVLIGTGMAFVIVFAYQVAIGIRALRGAPAGTHPLTAVGFQSLSAKASSASK